MNIIKDWGIPTLLIVLAAVVVSLAALPLAQTEFAEGVRTEQQERHAEQDAREQQTAGDTQSADTAAEPEHVPADEPAEHGAPPAILSFAKPFISMGIPGLITLGVLSVTRRWHKRRR